MPKSCLLLKRKERNAPLFTLILHKITGETFKIRKKRCLPYIYLVTQNELREGSGVIFFRKIYFLDFIKKHSFI